MNAQTLILAILNCGDASGYEIKKQSTDDVFAYFVDISYGSIYPTLSRLETDGLVTCRSQTQSGRPDKKVYSITQKGRDEFAKALLTPPQRDKFKSEFLLVAMCADILDRHTIEAAFDKRIDEHEGLIAQIKELHDESDHPATKWVTRYGLAVKTADLAFLRENRDELLAMTGVTSTKLEAAE